MGDAALDDMEDDDMEDVIVDDDYLSDDEGICFSSVVQLGSRRGVALQTGHPAVKHKYLCCVFGHPITRKPTILVTNGNGKVSVWCASFHADVCEDRFYSIY